MLHTYCTLRTHFHHYPGIISPIQHASHAPHTFFFLLPTTPFNTCKTISFHHHIPTLTHPFLSLPSSLRIPMSLKPTVPIYSHHVPYMPVALHHHAPTCSSFHSMHHYKSGFLCRLEPSFQFSNSAMEGTAKWNPVCSKTLDEVRQLYGQIKQFDKLVLY